MQPKRKWFLAFFAVAYPLDQATKLWIVDDFYYGETLTVISGFFDLTHVRNPGGAFSMFTGGDPEYRLAFFLAAGAIAVALLLVFYRRLPANAWVSAAALGGILGGALGNLTDRIVYGEVIDWLDFYIGSYSWPTFNVADSCIVVGVCVLILEVFLDPEDEEGDELVGSREQSSA
ncbi:MAG: signal peptidase II [Myxococcota bacterium]|jgi:signal peptidase II